MTTDDSSLALEGVMSRLDSVLGPHGFVFQPEHHGVSSGGQFANGFYRRGNVEIGLIYRARLGSVNYAWKQYQMTHSAYMVGLGHGDDCRLVYKDHFGSVARDGGDPVDALIFDLQQFANPMLEGRTAEFAQIAQRAHKAFQRRLSGK